MIRAHSSRRSLLRRERRAPRLSEAKGRFLGALPWLTLICLCCLCGCASSSGGGGSSAGSGDIQELHLFVLPVGLKSSQPGAQDGLAVRVFASSRSRAKGVTIRRGTLEILAFDGAVNPAPAQVWSFPAASLPGYAATSSLGIGYELVLPWKGARPTASTLTIMARYAPASGGPLMAAPSVIPNSLK